MSASGCSKTKESLTIRDEIAGRGDQPVAVYTHLAPGVVVRAGAEPGEFLLRGATQAVGLRFLGEWRSMEVIEGWISDRFGVRQAANVIVARAWVGDSVVLEHRFSSSA